MLQTEHSIELLQTSYIERMCKDIFDIESENDSVTTPFDPKVNLSKDDVPASAAERAKLSQLRVGVACSSRKKPLDLQSSYHLIHSLARPLPVRPPRVPLPTVCPNDMVCK